LSPTRTLLRSSNLNFGVSVPAVNDKLGIEPDTGPG
jgi:hypothetical protein